MDQIKVVFFDLDHTLWDFETNANATLTELFTELEIEKKLGVSTQQILSEYHEVNEVLWKRYRLGKITSQQLRKYRFRITFEKYGYVNEKLNKELSAVYQARCPKRSALFPGTKEVLTQLKKNYDLYLITNGFLETQRIKIASSGLGEFFSGMITSESAGVKKPHPNIFKKALNMASADASQSIMIGDDIEADVLGAENVGMKALWFNPKKKETSVKLNQIQALTELLDIL